MHFTLWNSWRCLQEKKERPVIHIGRSFFVLAGCPLIGADSTDRCNTLGTACAEGVLQMKQRPRIYYTETQKALMWERWRRGESLQQIAQLFDRNHWF